MTFSIPLSRTESAAAAQQAKRLHVFEWRLSVNNKDTAIDVSQMFTVCVVVALGGEYM